ncbi:hypothetical protein GCM10008916_05250 [Clostridium nitritogenes]|uniref:Uncharacterized protein n=1 Tax=Clostridium nitritogenes TaxID=83340 RepID=A0ABN1LHZ5_9CLOT
MKKILVPQKAKVTPKEVLKEISKFNYINKSPYSLSYYNVQILSEFINLIGSCKLNCIEKKFT